MAVRGHGGVLGQIQKTKDQASGQSRRSGHEAVGGTSAVPEPKASGDDNSGQAVANPCKGAGVLTRGKRRAGLRGRGGVPTAANRRLRPPPLISDRSPPSAAVRTCNAHSSATARRPAPRMRHGDVRRRAHARLLRHILLHGRRKPARVGFAAARATACREGGITASWPWAGSGSPERCRMRQDDERRTRRTRAGAGEGGTWLTRSRSRLALLRLGIGRLDAGRVRHCSPSPPLSLAVLSPLPFSP